MLLQHFSTPTPTDCSILRRRQPRSPPTTASSEHSWRSWNFAADRGGLRAQPLEKSPSASLEQDSMESWLTTRSTKRSHISTNSIYSRYPSHPHHSMTCS